MALSSVVGRFCVPGLDAAPLAATNRSPGRTPTLFPAEALLSDVPFLGAATDAEADTAGENTTSEEVGALVWEGLPADKQPEPTARATAAVVASRSALTDWMIFT